VTYLTKLTWSVYGHTLRDGPPPVLTLEPHDAIRATSVDWSLKFDELIAKLKGKYVMKIYDVTIHI
jgi:hypothetical protein